MNGGTSSGATAFGKLGGVGGGVRAMYQSEAQSQFLYNDCIKFPGYYQTPHSDFNGKIERKNHDFDTKPTQKDDGRVKLKNKDDDKKDGGCCG